MIATYLTLKGDTLQRANSGRVSIAYGGSSMEVICHHPGEARPCEYLPTETASIEYVDYQSISIAEYAVQLEKGWRRFGHTLFRPECACCTACQALRVLVSEFEANRSQKKVRNRNQDLTLIIDTPAITEEKLALLEKFHAARTAQKGWTENPTDQLNYYLSFIRNPFPTEEWQYFLDRKLVGVGYVDCLPQGFSAIYYFHDPELHRRSLGTFNILSLIERAKTMDFPHVYLGFYVKNSRSMSYKALFQPAEILTPASEWKRLRTK